MGMFDLVLCNHELFGAHKGEKHQTKDLEECFGGLLDDYEITPEGRLVFLEYTMEDHSDPNATGHARLYGCMTRVFTGGHVDMNYDGWLHLSVFGRVKFVDGTMVAFEPEPYSEDDEEPVDPGKQAARRIMRKRMRDLRRLADNDIVRDRGWHMTIRELSERLKEYDPGSEISVFVGNPRFTQGLAVIVLDRLDSTIEGQLIVTSAQQMRSKKGEEDAPESTLHD